MNEYEAVLRLQEIDLALMRFGRTLKAMPQQKKLAALAQARRKMTAGLTKIVGQRKDAELDVSDGEEQHAHLLAVAEQVKADAAARAQDFRHINDLEAQLTSIAKKIEKIEYDHGEKVRLLERLRKAERNAGDLAAKLDREEASLEASYRRDSADIMAEVRRLAAERKQVLSFIEPPTLATYDGASKRFDGLAVERLSGNVPSVCRVKLQPGLYSDVRHSGPITECPYCHRMLVTEDVAR